MRPRAHVRNVQNVQNAQNARSVRNARRMRSIRRATNARPRLPVVLAGVLFAVAAVAVIVPLLSTGVEGPATVTSARGAEVELYGRGLYRFDSVFVGAGNRGTDLVTLVLGLPLLAVSAFAYARGSMRGGAWLSAAFTWHLYVYASYALGTTAYNELYLAYVAAFSLSLFGLAATLRAVAGPAGSAAALRTSVRRKGLGVFLWASAAVTLFIWLSIPVAALLGGSLPIGLDHYSTLFTVALDCAVLVPLLVWVGLLAWRGDRLAPVAAFPLLALEALLFPTIAAQTAFQLGAGVRFTVPEVVGPLGGFLVLASFAGWFLWRLHAGASSGEP